jgi:hypothetical protein
LVQHGPRVVRASLGNRRPNKCLNARSTVHGSTKGREGKSHYLVGATGMRLRNRPVPAQGTQIDADQLPPLPCLESDEHCLRLDCSWQAKAARRGTGGWRVVLGLGRGEERGGEAYGPVDDADADEEAGGAERGHAPRGHPRRRRLVRPQRRRGHHRGWPPRMPPR